MRKDDLQNIKYHTRMIYLLTMCLNVYTFMQISGDEFMCLFTSFEL